MSKRNRLLTTRTSNYRPAVLGPPSAIWGLSSTAGFTLAQVEPMRRDAQVRLCLGALTTPLRTAEFFPVRAKNREVAAFVTRQFRRFWQKALPVALEAYPYGRSASEVLYRKVHGRTEFDDLKYLSPRDTMLWTVEGKPAWIRVKQMGAGRYGQTDPLPGGMVDLEFAESSAEYGSAGRRGDVGAPAKGFWFVHDPLFDPHYGKSVLVSAWLPWRMKTLPTGGGMDALCKWFYRHAYRGFVIRHPDQVYQDSADQMPVSAQDLARQIAENLKVGADLILSNAKDEQGNPAWSVESYGEMNGTAEDLVQYVAGFLDVQIQRGIGIPDGIITDGGGEGYAGRKIPEDAYYAGAESDFNRLVELFDEQVCRPLVALEFGPHEEYEIKPKPLVPIRQQAAQQAMQQGQGGEQEQPAGGGENSEEQAMRALAGAAGEDGKRPGGAPALSHAKQRMALSADEPRIIDLPDVPQKSFFDCGSACAMSVCRFFGVGPEDEDEYVRELPSTPTAGTPPGRMIAFLRKQGLRVRARSGLSLDDLRSYTRRGCPVLCPIQDYSSPEGAAALESGHWIVVQGTIEATDSLDRAVETELLESAKAFLRGRAAVG